MMLPELNGKGAMLMGIVALVGGIILGTHQPLHIEIIALVMSLVVINWLGSDLELGIIAYWYIWAFFLIGCVIGDVSWALQTGFAFEDAVLTNPFIVKE